MELNQNPLLNFTGLPKFDAIQPEHVSPAIDYLLQQARVTVEQLATDTQTVTWDNFANRLEDLEERLSRAWSQVGHLNAVVNSPALREAYNANLSKLTDFYADLAQDERLYAKFRQLRNSPQFAQLTESQKKIVENELRDFRLGVRNCQRIRRHASR